MATLERVTMIVFCNSTCYLILVVYIFSVSFLGLVFVACVTGFLQVVWP